MVRGALRSAVLITAIAAMAKRGSAQAAAPRDDVTVFVDVNVVPMDSERVLPHQRVLVTQGVIAAIGPRLAIPEHARIIDGHGTAFLSPGLADMHTHSDTREDLSVYLANGVTTVLDMGGASQAFVAQVRPAVNAGRIPGPHVYVSFRVDGTPEYGQFVVTTPDEARWMVRLAKTNGYDFIKVYNNLSPECFQAIIDEARRQHLSVVGHGVTRVGLERQLDAGQVLVAHTEEFLYTTFADSSARDPNAAPASSRIPAAIAFVERDHAFVTADLNTYAAIARQWGRPAVVQDFLRAPEVRYLAPRWRIAWTRAGYAARQGSLAARLDFLARFTKDMSDAGVLLVAGTDAPTIPGLVPGFSLHDDLRALEGAGLTPYRALATATRTPGELIRRSVSPSDRFGTVTPGSRADLILSASNPLRDLSVLRHPLGVMAAGAWYSAADLHALLEHVASEYRDALAPR